MSKHGWHRLATAVVCAVFLLLGGAGSAFAGTTFHVTPTFGTDGQTPTPCVPAANPCGKFQTVSSNTPSDVGTSNPALVHILLGDSVEFDWSSAGDPTDDSHSVTRTTGEDNTTHTAGTFDSGIHMFNATPDPANTGGSWVSTNIYVLGPGDLNAAGTYFFECFFHGPPMHGIITVLAFGTVDHFVISPSTGTPTAGTGFSVTVTAKDRNNNTVTSDNGSVTLSSTTDASATFSNPVTLTGGVGTGTVTLRKSGSQNIHVSDGSHTGDTTVNVQAAGLDHFGITAPSTATAGATTSISVNAEDAFNNVKTNYAGTIHFTSSDGAATLPGDTTLAGGSGGFGVIFNTVGTQSISVNDTVSTGITGSTSLTVNSANCKASDKTFSNAAAIPINDAPAPFSESDISVSMPGQVVGKVTVTLHGIHHTFYSDIDVMLQAPNGQRLVLQSFAGIGENAAVTPIELTFDDAATQVLPQNISSTGNELPGGSYRPTAYSASGRPAFTGLSAPFPLPGTAGTNTLESAFSGVSPNGVWKLYIQDNAGADSGTVDGGWSITITPAFQFTNTTPTTFSINPKSASPYPSPLTVSGLTGNITKLTLTLNNLVDNGCPVELEMLLQAPSGQMLVPYSGIGEDCGSGTISQFVLSDTAANLLPPNGSPRSPGLFKPTSDETFDFGSSFPLAFNAPLPTSGPYPEAANDGTLTFASQFNGLDPNGTWKLYVLVNAPPLNPIDSGSLGSWSLQFQLQCATCNASVGASTGTSSTFNQSVVFTGTLSSNFEVPSSGSVTFCDGTASAGTCTGTTLGTGPLDGTGNATFTTSALAAGAHSITANFAGDSTYPPATSAPLSFTVGKGTTQTFLSSSLNPSTFGQSVKFTANVVPGPFGGTPTGTVTFKDGATTLGSSALSAGTATFTTSALTASASPHSITAVYSSDASFLASTSTALTQTVNKAASATVVVSSLNPSTYGTSVNFTATVTSSAGTPTGTVTFKDGAAILGSPTLSAGKATLATSALSVSSHSITATYNGAGDYNTSLSATLTQTVNKQSTTATVITSKPSGAFFGQSITFTATVSASPLGASVPSGTVTFKDGATVLGTGTLSSQIASLTCAPGNACGPISAAPSSHSITAVYGGDGNYTGSTSSAITQTVNKTATTSAITSSLNPSSFGQSITLTATIASAVNGVFPNGTVTFCDGAVAAGACTGTILGTPTLNASGVATVITAALATGSHTLNALYGGSSNFNASDSTGAPLTQTVNKGATTTMLTVQETPAYLLATQDLFRHQITLTATVTSAGGIPGCSVTFKDNGVALGPAVNLVSGTAKLILPLGLGKVGLHPLTAAYSGCPNFNASTSAILKEYRSPKAH